MAIDFGGINPSYSTSFFNDSTASLVMNPGFYGIGGGSGDPFGAAMYSGFSTYGYGRQEINYPGSGLEWDSMYTSAISDLPQNWSADVYMGNFSGASGRSWSSGLLYNPMDLAMDRHYGAKINAYAGWVDRRDGMALAALDGWMPFSHGGSGLFGGNGGNRGAGEDGWSTKSTPLTIPDEFGAMPKTGSAGAGPESKKAGSTTSGDKPPKSKKEPQEDIMNKYDGAVVTFVVSGRKITVKPTDPNNSDSRQAARTAAADLRRNSTAKKSDIILHLSAKEPTSSDAGGARERGLIDRAGDAWDAWFVDKTSPS
jgi:hypothetical protein